MGFEFSKEKRPLPSMELQSVMVGCNWSPAAKGRVPYDLDCHAFGLMYPGGQMQRAILYRPRFGSYPLALTYANTEMEHMPNLGHNAFQTPDGSMIHLRDSTTGHGEGCDEEMYINLHMLPERVDEVAIWVTLHSAPRRKETFEWMDTAFVRIMDMQSRDELGYYPLKEKFAGTRSVHIASLIRDGTSWKFITVGIGNQANLEEIINAYTEKGVTPDNEEQEECTCIRQRSLTQFSKSTAEFSGTPLALLGIPDLALIDQTASEEILRTALSIAQSFSVEDPESRFAVFGSELQKEYGELMHKALKLSKDQRFRWARKSIASLLEIIDSINFSNLVQPEPADGWWYSLGSWLFGDKTPTASNVRLEFDATEKKVKQKHKQLKEHLESLEALRNDIVNLEQQRLILADAINAHVLTGRALSHYLEDSKKSNLITRTQSLQITSLTAAGEQQSRMLLTIVDSMMLSMREIMLTCIPAWLSAGKEAFALLETRQLTADSEAFQKADEARTAILTRGAMPGM